MPLTMEELIKTIETNQSTVMFRNRGHINEDAIRHSTGQLARCVAIIVMSVFVFLGTTYYQTLLLSIHGASAAFALKIG